VVQTGISALLALFAALSARNSPDQRAVITFKAREFLGDKQGKLKPEVRLLDREEVEKICRNLDIVQGLTDAAVADFWDERKQLGPSKFGTKVHKSVKDAINGPQPEPRDPNFKAEVSELKTLEEAPPEAKPPIHEQGKEVKYGTKDSIRVDVLENVGNGTVCVYDIKTGRKGLDPARMAEIARAVKRSYGAESQIIVTEVRPRY